MGGGVGLGVGTGVGTGRGNRRGLQGGGRCRRGNRCRHRRGHCGGSGRGRLLGFTSAGNDKQGHSRKGQHSLEFSILRLLFASNRHIRADAEDYVTKYTNGDWGFSTDFPLFDATFCPVCSQGELQRKGVFDALPDEILRRTQKSLHLSSSTAAQVDNGGNSS